MQGTIKTHNFLEEMHQIKGVAGFNFICLAWLPRVEQLNLMFVRQDRALFFIVFFAESTAQ